MRIYFGIVHKDEGSAYGVTFPDLPGCFSAADRSEDLVAEASQAIELYFEDQPDVAPSDIDAVARLAAEQHGAFVVAVPYIKSTRKTVRANISLDSGILDAIDIAAKQRNLTRSSFIAEAVQKEIVGAH
jgi:predicted RNase H-like HicB family nuclease